MDIYRLRYDDVITSNDVLCEPIHKFVRAVEKKIKVEKEERV